MENGGGKLIARSGNSASLEEPMLQNPVKRKLKEGKAIGRFPVAPLARIPWNTR